jgi:hypothetical protein
MSLAASPAHARSQEQTWDRDFKVTLQPTVRIETDDARVVVRSWKESRVTAHVELQGRTQGLVIGRRHPRVEITQVGNEVRVRARIEGSESGIVVFSSLRLSIEVWLPRESDLIVHSGDGAVNVEGVAGRIVLETQDGALTARGLRGDIAVRSSDGRVALDDLDGALQLEIQDGRVEISGRFDRFDVESQDGGIEADVLPGSRLQDTWSVRSQDGSIRLRIPRDLAVTLDARTQDGDLSIDLPVRIEGRVRRHELIGDLNGGGPSLRLRSKDGSIRVASID